jgi:hypothetical protein
MTEQPNIKHTAEDADLCESLHEWARTLEVTGKAKSQLVAGMLYTIASAIIQDDFNQLLRFHGAFVRSHLNAIQDREAKG